MHQHQPPDGRPISRRRLHDLISFEYRSTALLRLGVTAEWRYLDWINAAACTSPDTKPHAATERVTETTCARCPVAAHCLAAAIATDDTAPWRGGLDRTDRERLWTGLDRTYQNLRDFEAMRLDPAGSTSPDNRPATNKQATESNGVPS